MITGNVNPAGEAVVPLRIRDADGGFHEFDAIVDTGFNGLIALPPMATASLRLPEVGTAHVQYSDGSFGTLVVHEAVVEWGGIERLLRIDCVTNDVLIGTALLAGFDLRVEFVVNGAVEITRLS